MKEQNPYQKDKLCLEAQKLEMNNDLKGALNKYLEAYSMGDRTILEKILSLFLREILSNKQAFDWLRRIYKENPKFAIDGLCALYAKSLDDNLKGEIVAFMSNLAKDDEYAKRKVKEILSCTK